MPLKRNLAGQKFGRLSVIKIDHRKKQGNGTRLYWECLCDCGKRTVVQSTHILSGHTTSCGCFLKERQMAANTTHGFSVGGAMHEAWRCWNGMKTRCLNKNSRSYANYGGRGITICERWLGEMGFANFVSDMGPRPSSKHSVGRKENDKNYEPGNCRWETASEQGGNTRATVNITFGGRTQCRAAWSRETGISEAAITYRLKHGWSVEKALSTPSLAGLRRTRNKTEPDGAKLTSVVTDPRDWLAD
jgi:hypothetical protein